MLLLGTVSVLYSGVEVDVKCICSITISLLQHTYVILIIISLSTVVLNSRDRHEKHGVPLLRASITRLTIYFTPKS